MGESNRLAIRGQVLQFTADPFQLGTENACRFWSDGVVVVEDGVIRSVGQASDLLADVGPDVEVHDYAGRLIMAGFVDTHVHYPQMEVIASYGAQLIEWLNDYTFPAEGRFRDRDYAAKVAGLFLQESLRNGITTSAVYCTVHPESVDAFFEAAAPYGLRVIAGKVMMDRNAPDFLTDTAQSAYDDSKILIERWHGKGRALYGLTPRFAPTSTDAQLEAAGTLWQETPGVYMQTHVSENRQELAWVAELFPDCSDYLGVYEKYGLLGPRCVLGHGIYLSEREKAVIAETGSAVAHCPTSNLFIGSGLFDLAASQQRADPLRVGLATDIGGGTSLSIFATLRAAYEIAQLQSFSLHPIQAFYLATLGGAKSLYLDDKIGNLAPGYEADMVVIDLKSTPMITQRMEHAKDLTEALFIQMILADDRAIEATYSAGRRIYARDAGQN
ncbi:guanine deaminase [Denitrobaculum tricleocarpae]|uniref:Guanine deaminase n=1 Tax=Denitrobaculum tricleocarpae TaxID=2591009 RepID=A0A545TYH3_9PROT|nr:guanine deaminase [Denitrobaculum tricleocarpae]TQV82244.1 guanine deaminase [Denitrobaculum tricleocarpae]